MKKNLLFLMTVLFSSAIILSSCSDDDDPVVPNPPDPGPSIPETEYTSVDVQEAGEVIEVQMTVKDYGNGTGTVTWASDKTYILDGFVYVNDGQILTIQEGTIIKGKAGQGENASALIVARGGQIIAQGTANAPIVLTSLADDIRYNHIDNVVDGGSALPVNSKGLWGGLIVLGKASNNNTSDKRIEGIPPGEDRALYGGTIDTDNSGIIEYVSIRYGGTNIGADNEINGFTLGSVGSGTQIDHVEILSNNDDGVEFFGGSAELSHILVALCGDDSYDYDEGYHGKGQFWVAIQDANDGDRLGEHDGGPSDNEVGTPFANPVIYNATYISEGKDKDCIIFRDNAAGTYANSIFAQRTEGLRLEYRNDKHNSYEQLVDGELVIKNNLFSNISADKAVLLFAKEETDKGPLPADHATVTLNHFDTNANAIEDLGITYDAPVPAVVSANARAAKPSDSFYVTADYHGAFDPAADNWASWTRFGIEKGWNL